MAKMIKISSAPHLELRIEVSDEMIRDYRECAQAAREALDGKDCSTCSWREVKFGDTTMCELDAMKQLLEEE